MAHRGSEIGGHPRICVPWFLMAVTTALWRCAKGKPCLGVAHQRKNKKSEGSHPLLPLHALYWASEVVWGPLGISNPFCIAVGAEITQLLVAQ